jgi:hypothetical protein
MDLSTLQRAVQLLEVSTLQGPEVSLDYFEILLSMLKKNLRPLRMLNVR